MVHDAFRRSGLSQATLARRLNLGTDRVCRMLGSPANLQLDTLSDLFFAICGAELNYSLSSLFGEADLVQKPLETRTSNVVRIIDWQPEQREAA
jgi:hypothetical protein